MWIEQRVGVLKAQALQSVQAYLIIISSITIRKVNSWVGLRVALRMRSGPFDDLQKK